MITRNKILYIDDEVINVQLFKYNFSRKYEVITGLNGEDGLNCLDKFPEIKMVISDMRMPGMNGLEFITRAQEKYKDKTYFIITGYDINEEIKQAIETGLIRNYFKKPFNIKEIEIAIDEIL